MHEILDFFSTFIVKINLTLCLKLAVNNWQTKNFFLKKNSETIRKTRQISALFWTLSDSSVWLECLSIYDDIRLFVFFCIRNLNWGIDLNVSISPESNIWVWVLCLQCILFVFFIFTSKLVSLCRRFMFEEFSLIEVIQMIG